MLDDPSKFGGAKDVGAMIAYTTSVFISTHGDITRELGTSNFVCISLFF